jgi:hypothetical protein
VIQLSPSCSLAKLYRALFAFYLERMSQLDQARGATTAPDATPTCKVVSAKKISERLLTEVAEGIKEVSKKPLLVGFLASNDEAARVYAEWTGKTARQK